MRTTCFFLFGMFFASFPALAQENYLTNDNIVRWSSGTYDYISVEENKKDGEETWLLTVHPDGTRTLRATNSYDRYIQAFRHVVMRADKNFRPLEAYVDFWVDGTWRGSGMVTVNGNMLSGLVNGPNGQLAQTLDVPDKFSLIPHPISSNSWPTWYYDKDKGGAQDIVVYDFDAQGKGVGGVLGSLDTQTVTYVGEETIDTPAGEFVTDHFVFGDGDPHFYLFGPDRMLARMTWDAAKVEYVLSDYRSGP